MNIFYNNLFAECVLNLLCHVLLLLIVLSVNDLGVQTMVFCFDIVFSLFSTVSPVWQFN